MRATTATFLLCTLVVVGATGSARAETVASQQPFLASLATDVSAQERRRPRVRIYRERDNRGVYPSYFPGSNAVRDCNVTYVREFRPSGPVIVPNMKCRWRQP